MGLNDLKLIWRDTRQPVNRRRLVGYLVDHCFEARGMLPDFHVRFVVIAVEFEPDFVAEAPQLFLRKRLACGPDSFRETDISLCRPALVPTILIDQLEYV